MNSEPSLHDISGPGPDPVREAQTLAERGMHRAAKARLERLSTHSLWGPKARAAMTELGYGVVPDPGRELVDRIKLEIKKQK